MRARRLYVAAADHRCGRVVSRIRIESKRRLPARSRAARPRSRRAQSWCPGQSGLHPGKALALANDALRIEAADVAPLSHRLVALCQLVDGCEALIARCGEHLQERLPVFRKPVRIGLASSLQSCPRCSDRIGLQACDGELEVLGACLDQRLVCGPRRCESGRAAGDYLRKVLTFDGEMLLNDLDLIHAGTERALSAAVGTSRVVGVPPSAACRKA